MTIFVQQLRERALKATPGPWQHERLGIIQGGPMQTYVNGAAMPQLLTSHGADFMSPGEYLANADFVAAANPTAVLALLDEIDRLTRAAKYCEDIDATHENHRETMLYDMAVERDQLRAENAELKDGLNRIIRETRLGDVAFGIACEVMGELGVQQGPEEQQP